MRDVIKRQIQSIHAEPVERLLKPSIKAGVVIGILSATALYVSERYDRKGLARLTGDVQASAKPATRRP